MEYTEETTFSITNKYGIKIAKGCMSCKYRGKDFHPTACSGRKNTDFAACKEWVLRNGLDKAGKGDGKVKRKEYLGFVLKRLSKSGTVNISAEFLQDPEAYMEGLREEFAEIHGDVYYKM